MESDMEFGSLTEGGIFSNASPVTSGSHPEKMIEKRSM